MTIEIWYGAHNGDWGGDYPFHLPGTTYKLGYVMGGFTTFKVQQDGCGVLSAARALLGLEGL